MADRRKGPRGGLAEPVWVLDGMVDNAAIAAVREGNYACGGANSLTPGAVLTVLNTPGLVFNFVPGNRAMVTQYCFAVETVNDDCQFEFGWCDGPDATGNFHPIGPQKHVYTGAANQGITAFDQYIGPPPYPVSYRAGARSITFRVLANDAGCQITVGYWAWIEDEG